MKLKNKKGVSLIVLSITILVMAILAATAIIALEDSGIIGRSKNTVSKQNYIQEYERLQVIKNGILTDNFGEITIDEYITELTNKGLIESGVIDKADGSKSVTTKTGFVANIMQDGESNLIISLGTSNATITLTPTSLSGDITSGPVNKTITVNTSNVTGDITWTTSNANVATVTGNNSSATVTLKGIGSATITATYGNAKASCEVTVTGTVATPTITLNKTTISKTIDSGSTATDTITATTANISGSLTWTSSNTSVATVSASGNNATITMKAGGTAIITATYGSTSASCTVVVTENEAYTHYLSGVWKFNNTLNVENVNIVQEVECWLDVGDDTYNSYISTIFIGKEAATSETAPFPGSDIHRIAFWLSNAKYPDITGYLDSSICYVYDQIGINEWGYYWEVWEVIPILDFGSTPQGVSEEFYNWFTANATKQEMVTKTIYCDVFSWTITAYPSMTWAEIISQGITPVIRSAGSELNLSISNGYVMVDYSLRAPVMGTKVLATDKFSAYSTYYMTNDGYLYGS